MEEEEKRERGRETHTQKERERDIRHTDRGRETTMRVGEKKGAKQCGEVENGQ